MECPNCGTWNPEDKHVCWRCQATLPKPTEEKKKREMPRFLGLPVWAWIVVVILLLFPLLSQCGAPLLGQ